MNASNDLRYPLGKMPVPEAPVTADRRAEWLRKIDVLDLDCHVLGDPEDHRRPKRMATEYAFCPHYESRLL